MTVDINWPRSRRSILTGALGGAAAAMTATLAGAQRVLGAGDDGSIIHVADVYHDVRSTTTLQNTTSTNTVFSCLGMGTAIRATGNSDAVAMDVFGNLGDAINSRSLSGTAVIGSSGANSIHNSGIRGIGESGSPGVVGLSKTGLGIIGWSGPEPTSVVANCGVEGYNAASGGMGVFGNAIGIGVLGQSVANDAVQGTTEAQGHSGVRGTNTGNGTGVYGWSGSATPHAPQKQTGVYGRADQGAGSVGLRGSSTAGRGGLFNGKLAQLRLAPSAAVSHPHSGAIGDLFVDKSGRLWFCKGGTSWKQLA